MESMDSLSISITENVSDYTVWATYIELQRMMLNEYREELNEMAMQLDAFDGRGKGKGNINADLQEELDAMQRELEEYQRKLADEERELEDLEARNNADDGTTLKLHKIQRPDRLVLEGRISTLLRALMAKTPIPERTPVLLAFQDAIVAFNESEK